MEKQCICSCEEHLDMAFDDFLVEYEIWPELKKAEEALSCSYCGSKAIYCLENPARAE